MQKLDVNIETDKNMDNNKHTKLNLPDVSNLSENSKRIQDAMKPIGEAMQQYQDVMESIIKSAILKSEMVMSPFLDAIRSSQIKIYETLKKLDETARPLIILLDVIEKLGNAQFVYWDFMDKKFVHALFDSKNVNNTLREFTEKDKVMLVDDVIEKCLLGSLFYKHGRLFQQSVDAFKNGQNDLAVIGLTSIFDGLLSEASGLPTSNFEKRVSSILDKLRSKPYINSEERAFITLIMTFQKTTESFTTYLNFGEEEPKELNRHWIMHGRSHRKKTELDCIKLIRLIHGVALIRKYS